MECGKTTFVYDVADPQYTHSVVCHFLNVNNFKQIDKNGYSYFMQYDAIQGKKFFEFFWQGNRLTINVYIHTPKKPWPLDEKFTGSVPKQAYKNLLAPLLQQLEQCKVGTARQTSGMQMGMPQQGAEAVLSHFEQQNIEGKNKQAVIGFILAIMGLLLSFLGMMYGLIVYMLVCYFAYNGMSSEKRGLSIATFIICALSIVIFVMKLQGAM